MLDQEEETSQARYGTAALEAMADLATPMAVRVAATLRIADHLDQRTRTARELAGVVGADAEALDRVLRQLAAAGVLTRDEGDRYALTALGDGLRADHPAGLRARWDLDHAPGHADPSAIQLLHSVRTGADVPAIVAAYDWGALGHLVDVGGDGTLLLALLNEYPTLRGTVVDLPDAAEAARKRFEAAELTDRADAIAGDVFAGLPAGAEGYLLAAMLRDRSDEEARTILRNCATAAGADGAVFVIERIGVGRDVAALTALAEGAGLAVVAVHTAGPVAIVELNSS